jgi:small subunit ribosomal protein S19
MAKKIFTYRGKTLEELQALSLTQVAELLPSFARRKMIRRGFTEAEKRFLARLQTKNGLKTHCRDMVILPSMVTKTIKVAKGNGFDDVIITPEMIGHRLGEFAPTRKRVSHGAAGIGATKGTAHADKK